MNSVKTLARVGQLSMRNMRPMSNLKAAVPKDNKPLKAAVPEDNKPLPEGLIPAFYKFKADQKLYQQPDGIPIHFKRGARDKILFYITLALLGGGLVGCADFVYHLP